MFGSIRWFACAVVLLFVSPLVRADDAFTKKSAIDRLQGTWIGVVVGEEDEGKVTLTIDGNKTDFQREGSPEWYKGEIELGDENEKPQRMDGTIKDCPVPDLIGKVCKGIYKIDDDTLMISATEPGSDDGPRDFDDERCRTLLLKRKS